VTATEPTFSARAGAPSWTAQIRAPRKRFRSFRAASRSSTPPDGCSASRDTEPRRHRKIATAVGVKQASLYSTTSPARKDILAGLLAGTIQPSLEFARRLQRTREPAHVQLYSLTWFDVSLLASAK